MSEPVERRGARPPRRSRKALACVGAIVAGAHGAAAGADGLEVFVSIHKRRVAEACG